ncbi:hypothetical protein ACS0TY_026712 [Phlomoides rotata]
MIYCHVIPPTGDEAIEDLNDVGVEKLREFTYMVEWRPVGAYIKCNCRKFEFNGYPHMTTELYKKYQEVERFFQECVDDAMESIEKIEYIKE